MKSLPFSVFKRANRPCYPVSFKNEATGEYYPAISTRQKTEGEILALRLQDLGLDCLYVRGSWGKTDGLKLPKNNKPRTVELPFPDILQGLIALAKRNPWGVSPDSFIFWTEYKAGVPMQGQMFVNGLRTALVNSGFSKSEAGSTCFTAGGIFTPHTLWENLKRNF